MVVIPLLLVALILVLEISAHEPIGIVSRASIVTLSALSILAYASLQLRKRNEIKDTVDNIWLAVVAFMFSYAVADLALGYVLIPPISPVLMPDPYVHHRLKPNTYSDERTTDFAIVVRVNNLGMRGADVEPVKPDTVYRILMLGDSFTLGQGVKDNETFSAVLQKSLRDKDITVDGKTVQVLNGGVDSYTPILEYFQLTRQMAALQPDLVVVNFDMGDLIQEIAYRELLVLGPDGEPIGVPQSYTERGESRSAPIVRWINRNLFLTRLAIYHIGRLRQDEAITIENTVEQANTALLRHTLAADSTDRTEQWADIFDSILRMQRFCADNGSEFLLTVYPWGHQVNDSEWIPGRWRFIPRDSRVSDRSIRTIEEFATANDIPLFNAFPAFRSYTGEQPLYFKHDMHWTPRGHELMAAELERYVLLTVDD